MNVSTYIYNKEYDTTVVATLSMLCLLTNAVGGTNQCFVFLDATASQP